MRKILKTSLKEKNNLIKVVSNKITLIEMWFEYSDDYNPIKESKIIYREKIVTLNAT